MSAKIHVLDVGHGNCAVIDDKTKTIIDAGPKNGLLEFLEKCQIREIENVLLSHADSDHIGGLINLIASKEFKIKNVWLNTDSIKDSKLKDDLDWLLHRSDSKYITSLTRDVFGRKSTGNAIIEILGPTSYLAARGPGNSDRKGRKITSNSISAVIRVSFKDEPLILFPGDIDEVGLGNLIEENTHDLSAQILVFPHHGGMSGASSNPEEFTEKLCNLVQPRQVIFSIGRKSRYKTPLPNIVETILNCNSSIWISCTQLSKSCATQDLESIPNYVRRNYSMGASKNHCCMGTMTIELPEVHQSPMKEEHLEFIKLNVPNPLCRKKSKF